MPYTITNASKSKKEIRVDHVSNRMYLI
jgi:hypothetical protein